MWALEVQGVPLLSNFRKRLGDDLDDDDDEEDTEHSEHNNMQEVSVIGDNSSTPTVRGDANESDPCQITFGKISMTWVIDVAFGGGAMLAVTTKHR